MAHSHLTQKTLMDLCMQVLNQGNFSQDPLVQLLEVSFLQIAHDFAVFPLSLRMPQICLT